MSSLIAGTYNARDTGGTPLTDGGSTREGVLLRADGLADVTDEGLATIDSSPIGVVVDLRTTEERAQAPDRLPDSRPIREVHLSLLEGANAGLPSRRLSEEEIQETIARHADQDAVYRSMLEHGASGFAEIARLVAHPEDPQHPAVLVHCTAGKDRTGVAVALLLEAVGAERGAVLTDYAASAQNLAGPWAERMLAAAAEVGLPASAELTAMLTASPREVLERALTRLDEHGGAAAYLRSGGLTDADLDALQERLVG